VGVHIKDQIVSSDVDENGLESFHFELHYEDGGETNKSPSWAPSVTKALVDDALAAQTLAAWDAAVAARLPSATVTWYNAVVGWRRLKLQAAVRVLAVVR